MYSDPLHLNLYAGAFQFSWFLFLFTVEMFLTLDFSPHVENSHYWALMVIWTLMVI